jgi:alpha-L-rhamnosidase
MSCQNWSRYHGFQFVELTGWPSGATAPTLKTISAQVVHSDNRRIAALSFPSTGKGAILNQINDNIVRSLLSNMHSVESDCPTRERVGWTGDSQATAETAVRNLDMLGFYAKWLQDYEDAQCPGKPGCPGGNDHGALSSTIPFAKHVPPVDP